jgi:undecaprenyl-diphosphatase
MTRLRRLTRALVYGVSVAIPVTALAFLVRSKANPVTDFDAAAIASATAYTRARPGLQHFLLGWEWTTQPIRVYLVATLVCLWVWHRRRQLSRALWAFVTMMVGWNLALVLKYVVQRARPVVEDPITKAPGYSFPSGHVANMTIATTALVVLLWPSLRSTAARAAAIATAAALVVVTAGDRIWLGVHYPSDTVGGALFGVGLVLASYAGYVGWRPPKETP